MNAVYYNRIQAAPEGEREALVEKLRDEFRRDVDIQHLASELVIDAIVEPARLRTEIVAWFARIAERPRDAAPPKRRSVTPV